MTLTLFKKVECGETTVDIECYLVLETSAGTLHVDAGKNEKHFTKNVDYDYFVVCNIGGNESV